MFYISPFNPCIITHIASKYCFQFHGWACLTVFPFSAQSLSACLLVTWKKKRMSLCHSDMSDPRPHQTHGIIRSLKHKNTGQPPLSNSPFSPFPYPQWGQEPLFHLNNPYWIKSGHMLCSVRPMRTAVMGPIVNVPSLHLISLADTELHFLHL